MIWYQYVPKIIFWLSRLIPVFEEFNWPSFTSARQDLTATKIIQKAFSQFQAIRAMYYPGCCGANEPKCNIPLFQ